MDSCKHDQIVLLAQPSGRLRCRRCHLTISKAEIGDGYCPECLAEHGQKHSDFETLKEPENEKTRYRCEACGVIIEC